MLKKKRTLNDDRGIPLINLFKLRGSDGTDSDKMRVRVKGKNMGLEEIGICGRKKQVSSKHTSTTAQPSDRKDSITLKIKVEN